MSLSIASLRLFSYNTNRKVLKYQWVSRAKQTIGAAGSASAWRAGGHKFESCIVHQRNLNEKFGFLSFSRLFCCFYHRKVHNSKSQEKGVTMRKFWYLNFCELFGHFCTWKVTMNGRYKFLTYILFRLYPTSIWFLFEFYKTSIRLLNNFLSTFFRVWKSFQVTLHPIRAVPLHLIGDMTIHIQGKGCCCMPKIALDCFYGVESESYGSWMEVFFKLKNVALF